MAICFPWFDLLVPDVDAAGAFLGGLFGFEVRPVAGSSLRVLVRGDVPLVGLLPLAGDADPHWIAHVAVDDVAAVVRRVKFLQGTVLETPEEGQALVADPAGAVLAPVPADGTHAGPPFVLLLAPRRDLAVRVYRSLLDLRELSVVEGAPGRVSLLASEGRVVAGAFETELVGPQWVPCVPVPSLEAALAAAAGLDADVLVTVDVPGVGRAAVVVSAEGAPVGLLER